MLIEPEKFQLTDYIGKEYDCVCGKKHRTPLKEVLIDPGVIFRVPELVRKYGHKNVLVICDSNTYEAAGKKLISLLTEAGIENSLRLFTEELVPDETSLGSVVMSITRDCDLLIGVGTGCINDLSKFASFMCGREYFIVATAPSMDGFASVGAPLISDNLKTTFDAHSPEAIIGDTDILCRAPMDLINAGLGDILGKFTCLTDWKLSQIVNEEYYCPTIVRMVEHSIAEVMDNADGVKKRDPKAVSAIMKALVLTGIAMYYAGNSRPASGCEHHLSHFLEMRFLFAGRKPVFHGRKVAVGAVTCCYMYHRLIDRKIDFAAARKSGGSFDFEAWKKEMEKDFDKAAPGVILLEEKVGKNDSAKCLKRIDTIEKHWDEITGMIRNELPQTERLISILKDLGAPYTPQGVGVERELYTMGIKAAKEVRDRYTLLQLLWDLGLLNEFAEDAAEHFFDGNV